MIIPLSLDLTVRRNDNPFRALIAFEDADGATLNLTGYTGRLQVRLHPGADGDPLIEALSSASSGTRLILNADGATVVIVKTDLQDLPEGAGQGEPARLSYDLLLQPPGGDENAWAEGVVIVKPGVTA